MTCVATPHLDGKHVVFGRVAKVCGPGGILCLLVPGRTPRLHEVAQVAGERTSRLAWHFAPDFWCIYLFNAQGMGIVRRMERVPTENGDKPTLDVKIRDCGEIAEAGPAPPRKPPSPSCPSDVRGARAGRAPTTGTTTRTRTRMTRLRSSPQTGAPPPPGGSQHVNLVTRPTLSQLT